MEFEVIQGDIAQQSADILVNAAGTSLQMGSGVAGSLRRCGGEAMNEAAMEQGPVDLGDVAVTDAYDLDAEWVVHAAAMPHYGDGKATAESIEDATRHALHRADSLGAESLVLPALGCGVAGFDLEAGARLICETLDAHEPGSLTDVSVIAYGDEEYEQVEAVAAAVQSADDGEDQQAAAPRAETDGE